MKKFIDLEIKTDELDGLRSSQIKSNPKSQVIDSKQISRKSVDAPENIKLSQKTVNNRVSPNLENTNDARKLNSLTIL